MMQDGTPYVELRIDLREPAELVDLVAAFAAIANQFERYIQTEHRNLRGAAKLHVKDIRQGSIIVELLPLLQPLVVNMDTALIVDGFVRRFGGLLTSYTSGKRVEAATKSYIRDIIDAVAVIANDRDGKSAISSMDYHETKSTQRLNIEFDTEGARRARETAQLQRAAIDLPAYEVIENKLMVFLATTVRPAETGRKTQLRALIEAVCRKPLAIIYETDMARERIEDEIREDEKNVYKKGFLVDCYVEKFNGKPVAYRITQIHDIIPLPDDD
jgi:hypothetical protein